MNSKKLKTENLIMIKKYYIEEKDGKEIKRKQTIHEAVEIKELKPKEQLEVFYEATAELLSKVRKVNAMFDEIKTSNEFHDSTSIQIFVDALNNIESVKEFL